MYQQPVLARLERGEAPRTDRERGLMHRDEVPAVYGMLFVEDCETPIRMWMKDTSLELDVLFLRGDGVVHRIEHNLEPMSERMIWSHGVVRAMLEIRGGSAEKLGLTAGNIVCHQAFTSSQVGHVRDPSGK